MKKKFGLGLLLGFLLPFAIAAPTNTTIPTAIVNVKELAAGSVATPAAGYQQLYIDSTSHFPSIKNSSATATPLVTTTGTQTLTNKTLSGNTASSLINGSGTLSVNSSGTITIPNATDTLVGKATTDTLTNKTISGNTATNLISGSGTLTLPTSGTITVPNGTDTLVGKATTDTLTNKTLTTPVISSISNSGTLSLPTGTINIFGGTPSNHGMLISGAGGTVTVLAPDASTTKVWTSGGSSADPSWQSVSTSPQSSYDAQNVGLAASVSVNAMTIALKQSGGSDCAAGSAACAISFRNSTAATGQWVQRTVTAALSTVISSGSTAGSVSAFANWVYVYAIDNAGTVELAWSGSKMFDEGSLYTTTAEGGAGAADDKFTLYSTTARTGVAIRLLGRIKSTQATAGTWASAPSEISLWPFNRESPRSYLIHDSYASLGGSSSGDTKIINLTNVRANVGPCITYTARTTTTADFWTINCDGTYSASLQGQASAGGESAGITVNDTATTTNIQTPLTYAQGARGMLYIPGASQRAVTSWDLFLTAGSVVRLHGGGDTTWATNAAMMFMITQTSF